MSKPLVSICIPTYNRSKYLKKCIDSIISQVEFQNGLVEIVISDNASEDDTQEVVLTYSEKYKNVLYSKNSQNVKDKNYPIVLSKANGVLRRLCNDALIFQPNSLNSMCEVVKKYKSDRPYLFWANGVVKVNMENVNFQEFVRETSFRMTSIACFSIWEDDAVNLSSDLAGSELLLWQVRKALELVYNKKKAVINNTVLTTVQSVQKKNISYGLYQVFFLNFFQLLQPYFDMKILTECDRDKLEKDLLFDFFLGWCVEWELQNSNFQYSLEENLKQVIEKQYSDKSYWKEYQKKYKIEKIKCKIKKNIKSVIKIQK